MRILWVENYDSFVRIAGKQFLSAHERTVVPSVAAARTALSAQTFDAVLIDYDLDDGKGSEVMKVIRQLPDSPVVIATSSHADGNAALLTAGADAACPKTKFSMIETILRNAIAKRKQT